MGNRHPSLVERVLAYLFIANQAYLLIISRQIPGLPKSTAGQKKTKKKAIGPNGRISDPIARRAAQQAAKEAARRLPTLPSNPTRAPSVDEDVNMEDQRAAPVSLLT